MQIFNYNIIMYENNADLKGLCMYTETEITGVDPNNKKKIAVNLNTCDRLTC